MDHGNPEMVAAAFVTAYTKQNWKVDGPLAYLDRIAPYTTTAYLAKLRGSSGDRCGVTCEAAQKKGVTVSASNVATVIPGEAPRTPTAVWVQVTYVERTTWGGGGDGSNEAMNLKVVKTGGKWLVDARTGE
jgi:hypothetical protein